MAVGQAHALGGQPVQILRVDTGGRIHTRQVAVAQVVGQNQDNIGSRCGTHAGIPPIIFHPVVRWTGRRGLSYLNPILSELAWFV